MDQSFFESINKVFHQTLEYDQWGQIIEAAEGYSKVSSMATKALQKHGLSQEKKITLAKIEICMKIRASTLHDNKEENNLSLDEIKSLIPVFEGLTSGKKTTFPLSHSFLRSPEIDYGSSETSSSHLLPPPDVPSGSTLLTIQIEKIGLKDAPRYVEPFITISAYDDQGGKIEEEQHTEISTKRREPKHIYFNSVVNIQTPLNALPRDSAIFFEFKHYKAKKDKISTRCWTFMEMDEIKNGNLMLELYKKPTKHTRKKLKLFTIKKLYLHLKMEVYRV
eukprot:gb/GECH01000793.1/.p1 GENE.gb/GECH01000793.1/~~gb/GECH01000793.1/.p1  ORF type:complete len:278 (+),score=53.14 gb/GECH01000793.1/:1-834(+)